VENSNVNFITELVSYFNIWDPLMIIEYLGQTDFLLVQYKNEGTPQLLLPMNF
jgi:hypothetical protein